MCTKFYLFSRFVEFATFLDSANRSIFCRAFLKAQAIAMLVACVTINRKVKKMVLNKETPET